MRWRCPRCRSSYAEDLLDCLVCGEKLSPEAELEMTEFPDDDEKKEDPRKQR